jgi:hypothetical protein
MITFPAIRPSTREFIAGRYPVVAPEFKNVRRYARLGGTSPTDHAMTLDFLNITDLEAAQIVECYRRSYGGFLPIQLSSELFSGILFETLVTSLTGRVKWYFSQKPVVEAVFVGYSSVKVSLKGVFG